MTQQFIIPPRTSDGNEIRKFHQRVCQLLNKGLEVDNSLARAYLGIAQEGLTSAELTKVLLVSEGFDIGNNFSSYKYTAPVPGYYHFDWSAYIRGDGGTLTSGLSYLYKDGAPVGYGAFAAGSDIVSTGSRSEYAAEGSYFELYALGITSSSTWKIAASELGTFLSVALIARA